MTEHQWKKDSIGNVDEMAWDCDDYESSGGHNGPECTICGYEPCVMCVKVYAKKDVYDPEQFPCAGPPPEGKEWYFPGGPDYSSVPRKAW